jgi:hypothetical protein
MGRIKRLDSPFLNAVALFISIAACAEVWVGIEILHQHFPIQLNGTVRTMQNETLTCDLTNANKVDCQLPFCIATETPTFGMVLMDKNSHCTPTAFENVNSWGWLKVVPLVGICILAVIQIFISISFWCLYCNTAVRTQSVATASDVTTASETESEIMVNEPVHSKVNINNDNNNNNNNDTNLRSGCQVGPSIDDKLAESKVETDALLPKSKEQKHEPYDERQKVTITFLLTLDLFSMILLLFVFLSFKIFEIINLQFGALHGALIAETIIISLSISVEACFEAAGLRAHCTRKKNKKSTPFELNSWIIVVSLFDLVFTVFLLIVFCVAKYYDISYVRISSLRTTLTMEALLIALGLLFEIVWVIWVDRHVWHDLFLKFCRREIVPLNSHPYGLFNRHMYEANVFFCCWQLFAVMELWVSVSILRVHFPYSIMVSTVFTSACNVLDYTSTCQQDICNGLSVHGWSLVAVFNGTQCHAPTLLSSITLDFFTFAFGACIAVFVLVGLIFLVSRLHSDHKKEKERPMLIANKQNSSSVTEDNVK